MKEIIEVKRANRVPSRVIIGDVIADIKSYIPDAKVIVITDANLHRRYQNIINEFDYILIGVGETNKTLLTVEKIYHNLIELGVDRHYFILGIGGGIVTDIAGFVASTYMRGLRFGFVATSLLAQVDASVGGKNGVNVEGYKNMVGTFNQPDFVICDTLMLKTLPDREFCAGLGEIIKSGVIADPLLFELLEDNSLEQIKHDQKLLTQIITAAVRVKATIVEADEREMGERKKLNLGHTFAHAVEKCSSEFLHGEAVAIGMAIICDLSVKLGTLSAESGERIKSVITKMGLPIDSRIDKKRLLKAIKLDKKRDSTNIDIILINEIGACEIRKMSFLDVEDLIIEG